MIAEKMKGLVKNNSVIREMFEEGNRLAEIYGRDGVYDFSLGNPNMPAPKEFNDAVIDIINNMDTCYVNGYMSNAGYKEVREVLACSLNRRFGTAFTSDNLIMTVGAAGGLNVILKTIINPGDEVVVFAPYFLEYRSYVNNYDGILVETEPDTDTFQLNIKALEKKITPRTKAVIINNPNNPTGVIYPEETVTRLAGVLTEKSREYGNPIYLISDEPYRELAYDGASVPYPTKYYNNTIVCYSYSKSLSLPGERIGYLVIPGEIDDYGDIYAAAGIANRILGFVNAPSLMQLAVARCVDAATDIASYDRNRKLLYTSLKEYGYECVKPEGAFYLFVKTPSEDEKEFVNAAKKHNILVVPGSSFACPGYVRIAYCVSYDTIRNSLPGFKALAKEFGLA